VSQSDDRALSQRTAAPAAVSVPSTTPAPPAGSRSPAEIEREIEATRARLATSIDELADRVSPKNVAKRGAEKARLTVVDEAGAPRTTRIAAIGAAVAALAGLVLWRRRG
jgi:hypothetical protein